MGIGWQISLCFDYGLLYLLLLRSHETSKSWGRGAFLHNVIMASQNHNATLCKEAWVKKLLAQVAQRTCFF